MDFFEHEAISVDVGARLRFLRKARDLTIRALARSSGISANALSMIERGKNSPTVSTLCRVSEALGIPISSLFASEPEQSDVVFISRSSRARVPFTRGLWEGLGGERFSGSVEPFALTLESGSNSGPFPITHTGHEFVYCIRGQLEYQVQGEIFELKSGDSLLFSSHLQHRWRNPGPTVTDVIFVLAGFEGEEPLGVQHLANPSQNS